MCIFLFHLLYIFAFDLEDPGWDWPDPALEKNRIREKPRIRVSQKPGSGSDLMAIYWKKNRIRIQVSRPDLSNICNILFRGKCIVFLFLKTLLLHYKSYNPNNVQNVIFAWFLNCINFVFIIMQIQIQCKINSAG